VWLAALQIDLGDVLLGVAGLMTAYPAFRLGAKHLRRSRTSKNGLQETIAGLRQENQRLRMRLEEVEPRLWYTAEVEAENTSLKAEVVRLRKMRRSRSASSRASRS